MRSCHSTIAAITNVKKLKINLLQSKLKKYAPSTTPESAIL